MSDNDQQRDYVEESYWRNYCPECDGPLSEGCERHDREDLDT